MRVVFAGLATLDVVHRVHRLPAADEKLTASGQVVTSGGPAANAAKTHAALGGDATLLTALGSSPVARLVRADLEASGVRVVDVEPDAAGVPVSAVSIVPSGERSVVGHEVSPGPDGLDVAEHLEGAASLLVDGHYPSLAVAAARAAADLRVDVVVDAGRPKPVFDDLWPHASVALCSHGYRTKARQSMDNAVRTLLDAGVKRIAFTHGAGPIRWWAVVRGSAEPARGQVRPRAADAVDTLGAGDVLHGAYCYVRSRRRASFPDLLQAAADLASASTETFGLPDFLARLTREQGRRVRWSR